MAVRRRKEKTTGEERERVEWEGPWAASGKDDDDLRGLDLWRSELIWEVTKEEGEEERRGRGARPRGRRQGGRWRAG